MKDKWLKDLHDRMSEFEMDSPEHLWDEIERAELQRLGKRRVPVWLWCRRLAAAAAVVAIVLTVVNRRSDSATDSGLADGVIAAGNLTTSENGGGTDGVLSVEGNGNVPVGTGRCIAGGLADNRRSAGKEISTSGEMAKTDEVKEESYGSVDNAPDTAAQRGVDVPLRPLSYGTDVTGHQEWPQREKPWIAASDSRSSRFSVGVYSSEGIRSNNSNRSTGIGTVASGPDDSGWNDSPVLGILLYNKGKGITTDIRHRQPVRFGVSFTYSLTDRIGIGTGVTYADLSSDLKSGSDCHYFTGEQTLHYIGVPVNVSYDVFRWRRLRLYAAAGMLGEKCVYGKKKMNYVIDGRTGDTQSEEIERKPFQFSVNASAGIQFDIINSIGLYAEPGVSYYFDDGTEIKTIYKDKPLNFNLNFGVRFTFGR